MMQNHYRTLGLSDFASINEVKSIYKTLAKKYHPDKNPNNAFAEEHFKELSNAYTTLSDPLKKKVYDDRLKYRLSPPSPQPQKKTKYEAPRAHPNYRTRYYRRPNEDLKKKKKKKKKERKIYIITTLIGLLLITIILIGSHYLNLYSAKKYYKVALFHLEAKRFEQALLNLELARRYDTFNSEINELEGDLVILERKAYNEALFYYTEAMAQAETVRYETFFKRAKTFMWLDRYDESIKDFEQVITQPIKQDSAFLYLGELFLNCLLYTSDAADD